MKKEMEVILLDKNRGKFSFNIFIFIILIFAFFLYITLKTTKFENFNFLRELINPYIGFFESLLIVLIIFILTYFFVNFTKKLIKKYLTNLGKSNKNIKLFLIIYEYFVWIFIVIITFSIVLKQGASLITSIGLIGFGLTLALQKPILNFAGWITIIFGKTYHIEDIISINNIIGKVYDIRIMYTYLGELNSDGDPTGRAVFVPNEFVFTSPIINYSRGTHFVWDSITFYLTYRSNWKKAAGIIEKTIQDFYDKNIKEEAGKIFKNSFEEYEKVVTRINVYEKGIVIKVRYIVNFNQANNIKGKLTEILLEKLKLQKDIFLGKTENVE